MRRLVRNTGVVFDALTERDGQLRALITNSNRVFQTTARARRASSRTTFRALPTFEPSRRTTRQPPRRSSRNNANPLVTQLRPGGAPAVARR